MRLTFKNVLKNLNKTENYNEILDQVNNITTLLILCSAFINPSVALVASFASSILAKNKITSLGKYIISHFKKTELNTISFEISYILIHYTSFFDALKEHFPELLKSIELTETDKFFIIKNQSLDDSVNINNIDDFVQIDRELSLYELEKKAQVDILEPEKYLSELFDKLIDGFICLIRRLKIWDELNQTLKDNLCNKLRDLKVKSIRKFDNQLITLCSEVKGFDTWLNRLEHRQLLEGLNSLQNTIDSKEIISSLQTSLDAHIDNIKNIDPNLDVEINIRNKQITEYFVPHKPISLEMEFPDSKNKLKFQKFIENEKIIRYKSSEIKITGSEYFNQILNKKDVSHIELKKHPKHSNIVFIFNKNSDKPEFINIKGLTYFGTKNSIFEGKALNGLINIKMKLRNIKTISIVNFSINFDLSLWQGNKFLELLNFDRLNKFCNSLTENDTIFSQFSINELEIFNGHINLASDRLKIMDTINLIYDCRIISKHFKINPYLTSYEELFEKQRYIDIYKNLIQNNVYIEKSKNYNISLNAYLNENFRENQKEIINENCDFMFISNFDEIDFFDELMPIGKLVWIFSNWKVSDKLIVKEPINSPTKLKLIGQKESDIRVFIKPEK